MNVKINPMNKRLPITISLLLLSVCSILSQEYKWQSSPDMGSRVFAQDKNIMYIIDSIINLSNRNNIITKINNYIKYDLELLKEDEFKEPCVIGILQNRGEIYKYSGKRMSSSSMLKDNINPVNQIFTIYDQNYGSLNREVMKVILSSKWGKQKDNRLIWLIEGLATYVTPEADNCDGLNLEEKYTYLAKNEKLIDLTQFPKEETTPEYKAARIQSAYIVKNLLDKYGIEALKQLWSEGMDNFDKIYESSFDKLVANINKRFRSEYNNIMVQVDWETFTLDCINPQPQDWIPIYDNHHGEIMVKEVDNITFMVSSSIITNIDKANEIIEKARDYIAQNLALINESGLESSMQLILVQSRDDVEKISGGRIGGMAHFSPEEGIHSITLVYNDSSGVLKHELMHAVSIEKWGDCGFNLLWLAEGLAIFAAPESEECTGYTLEERYAYLMQNNKLLELKELFAFPYTRISYSQSGYLVKYIIEKYGIDKLKKLWQDGMDSFEKIYGLSFEKIISNINLELNKKYPNPIGLDWDTFNTDCVEGFIHS